MAFAIHSIGDAAFLSSVLNSVAMAFGSGNYATLISIGLLLGVFAVMVQAIFRGAREIQWHQVLLGWLIYACMFVPTTTVLVEDAYEGTVRTVDNVPIGVGFSASMISNVGFGMAKLFETAYGDAAALTTSPFAEPLRILNAVRFSTNDASVFDALDRLNNQSDLRQSLRNYVQDCTMAKLSLLQTTADAFNRSNAFDALRFDSRIYGTLINVGNGWENAACTDAWTKLGAALGKVGQAAGTVAASMGLESSAGAAGASLESRVDAALQFLGGIATSAQNYMKLALIEPVMLEAHGSFYRNMGDAATALMLGQAVEQRNLQWTAESSMFNTTIRPFLSFFEGFIFAVTPILAFLIATGGIGMQLAARYVQLIFWIQLWFPVLSIVNFYVVSAAAKEITALSLMSDSFHALNRSTEALQTWIATGGMLAASTPLISLFLVTGSTYAFTSLTARMQGSDHINEKAVAPDVLETRPYYAGETVGHGNAWRGTVRTGAEDQAQTISLAETAASVAASAEQRAQNASSALGNVLTTNYSESRTRSQAASAARTLARSMAAVNGQVLDAARTAVRSTAWGQKASAEAVDQVVGAIAATAAGSADFRWDAAESAIGKIVQTITGGSTGAGASIGISGETREAQAASERKGFSKEAARELTQSLRSVDASEFRRAAQATLSKTSAENFAREAGIADNEAVSLAVNSAITEQKSFSETASAAKTLSSQAAMTSTSLAAAVLRSAQAEAQLAPLFTDERLAEAADRRATAMARAGIAEPSFTPAQQAQLRRTAAMLETLASGSSAADKRTLVGIAQAALGLRGNSAADAFAADAYAGLEGPKLTASDEKLHSDFFAENVEAETAGFDQSMSSIEAQAAAGQEAVEAQMGRNSEALLSAHAQREREQAAKAVRAAAAAFSDLPPKTAGLPAVVRTAAMTENLRHAAEANLTPAQSSAMNYVLYGGMDYLGLGAESRKALLEENRRLYGSVLSGEELEKLTNNQIEYMKAIAKAGDRFPAYLEKFQQLNAAASALGEHPYQGRRIEFR